MPLGPHRFAPGPAGLYRLHRAPTLPAAQPLAAGGGGRPVDEGRPKKTRGRRLWLHANSRFPKNRLDGRRTRRVAHLADRPDLTFSWPPIKRVRFGGGSHKARLSFFCAAEHWTSCSRRGCWCCCRVIVGRSLLFLPMLVFLLQGVLQCWCCSDCLFQISCGSMIVERLRDCP